MSSIEKPTHSEPLGPFNGIAYIRHRGEFRGATAEGGEFSVPYEITVPATPPREEQVFVFEPPHVTSGLIGRKALLGEEFLFENGYSYASCGFGNRAGHILDPNPGFTLKIRDNPINVLPPNSQDKEVVDLNIIRQFAIELRQSEGFFGPVRHLLALGFSDSGKTIHSIYKPFGHKFFDLTIAGTAPYLEPVNLRNQNPIMVLNTEADFDARAIPNPNFPAYRYYTLACAPHIPDTRLTRPLFPGPFPPPIAGTTPMNWSPFGRALFEAGDKWIRRGKQPPPSATLKLNSRGEIVRDDMQNALGGIRHPAVQLREAQFVASVDRNGWRLFGDYRNPRPITDAEFPEYLRSFRRETYKLFEAGYLSASGRDHLIGKAQMRPPNTFTLNYRAGLVVLS